MRRRVAAGIAAGALALGGLGGQQLGAAGPNERVEELQVQMQALGAAEFRERQLKEEAIDALRDAEQQVLALEDERHYLLEDRNEALEQARQAERELELLRERSSQ